MSELRKIQVSFGMQDLTIIENLRKSTGRTTVASVVRDALLFYEWCRRATAEGFTIVATKGEKTKEPILPFPRERG